MADLNMALAEAVKLNRSITHFLKFSTYMDYDDLSGLDIDFSDSEQLLLWEELRRITDKLADVQEYVSYLTRPITEVSILRKGTAGKYRTAKGHYYDCRSNIEALVTDEYHEVPYYQADKVHQGALPVPVRLMMDEFCNVSLPDDFGKLQATMRSRNIMSTIVLQNISALKALFKDDWEGLMGNADTLIYLGGNEQSTHKYISEMLGKETLDTRNRSISKGSHGSSSTSYQQTGRELLTPDEVRAMDNAYAIVFIRGERPVIDKKYDILKHPNIKLTEDGGAAPYIHHPGLTFAQEDLSLPFDGLDNILIIDEEELSNEKDH